MPGENHPRTTGREAPGRRTHAPALLPLGLEPWRNTRNHSKICSKREDTPKKQQLSSVQACRWHSPRGNGSGEAASCSALSAVWLCEELKRVVERSDLLRQWQQPFLLGFRKNRWTFHRLGFWLHHPVQFTFFVCLWGWFLIYLRFCYYWSAVRPTTPLGPSDRKSMRGS